MKVLFDSFTNSVDMKETRIFILILLIIPFVASAQTQKEKPAVTYEELYDEPFSINKLFIGFQPLYGELFATNVNAGFGIEASYFHKDKFDLKANFRMPYSSEFFDFNRQSSLKSQTSSSVP